MMFIIDLLLFCACSVGHRYGMSMLEFGHFLHLTLLLPYGCVGDDSDRKPAFGKCIMVFNFSWCLIWCCDLFHSLFCVSVCVSTESVFLSTVSTPGGGDSKQYPLMSRCEFVEGILQALLVSRRLREREECKDDDDDDGKEESKSARDGSEAVGMRQLEVDLQGYLEANVINFWGTIAATSMLYCSSSPEVNGGVKETVYHMYQIIKQAFLAYATVPTGSAHVGLGPGLPTREFENMLEECSLLDSSNADHMEYLTQAMRHASTPAIAPSESFNSSGAGKGMDSPKRWGQLPSLCFCEILDCIMKLAVISLDAK